MASSNLIIIIIVNICLTFVSSRIGEDIINSSVYDDIALDIQLDSLLESNIQEKTHELGTKDETIKWMDDNIQDRSSDIALLLKNLLAVHVKGSLDDKEQVHWALARINKLETQVANVSKKAEKLSQKNSELKWKLKSLKRINSKLKTIIRETECALQVAEEEMIKAKTQETAFFRELLEAQESWLPHWLSFQWKEKGSSMLDPIFQKKADFNKWAKPHIITVKTLRTSTQAFLRTDELTEALKIFLFLASAFMASQIIFRRKNLDSPASKLQRSNSHQSVALEDGYLERTSSGNYSGEYFPKVKKRKIMSNSFDAKDHYNTNTDNDSLSTKFKREAARTERKKWNPRSRTRKGISAQENSEEKSPSLEFPSEEQLIHGNLMNKDEITRMTQVESKIVDKAMCPQENLLQQKETVSSLFVRDADKSQVVSGCKRARWRFGKKKSTTSDERTKKEKKVREIKCCGQRANWKSNKPGDRSGQTFSTANEVEVNPFTKEQMEHLFALLKSYSPSGIPTISVAQTGPEFGEGDWQC